MFRDVFRTFFVAHRWSGPSILFFSNLLTGCASSGFFTTAFVSGDERLLAAPSPTCFEVWKGRGSFFQLLRCTGGGGCGGKRSWGCFCLKTGVSWWVCGMKEGGAEPGDEERENCLSAIKSGRLVFCLWELKASTRYKSY